MLLALLALKDLFPGKQRKQHMWNKTFGSKQSKQHTGNKSLGASKVNSILEISL
jgi:hypothetical protein